MKIVCSGLLIRYPVGGFTWHHLQYLLGFRKLDRTRRTSDGRSRGGWRVRHAHAVASTPWDYQTYIQRSRGEFSCVKPSCVYLQNAWMSDRTLCYLASGKPAVVQHTGPSRFLPDAAGLFRFRDLGEAVRCLVTASADYERQCGLARALAEEYLVVGYFQSSPLPNTSTPARSREVCWSARWRESRSFHSARQRRDRQQAPRGGVSSQLSCWRGPGPIRTIDEAMAGATSMARMGVSC